MSSINWDLFKCRCSAISKMLSEKKGFGPLSTVQIDRIAELEARTKPMTDLMKVEYVGLLERRERSKELVLSDTCIAYLMEVYAWETEGMISISKEFLDVMAMEKGKKCEVEAGQLLDLHDNVSYKQHKERISNDFLTGEVDFYLGESIYKAINITDTKNAFDYPTFLKKINTGLESGQTEQLQGYGDITGARVLFVANTLVTLPEAMILDLQFKVAKKMDAVTTESPEFLEEWKKWEKSMRFDHMPVHKRVYKIPVEPFTNAEQQKVYDRVKVCRQWLWKFDESYQKINSLG